jgi:hypothetical protein
MAGEAVVAKSRKAGRHADRLRLDTGLAPRAAPAYRRTRTMSPLRLERRHRQMTDATPWR